MARGKGTTLTKQEKELEEQIITLHVSGVKYSELEQMFGIPKKRLAQIFKNAHRREYKETLVSCGAGQGGEIHSTEFNYKSLASEIVAVSYYDYRNALLNLCKYAYKKHNGTTLRTMEIQNRVVWERTINDTMRFWQSGFYSLCTDIEWQVLYEDAEKWCKVQFKEWKEKCEKRRKPTKEFMETIKRFRVEE